MLKLCVLFRNVSAISRSQLFRNTDHTHGIEVESPPKLMNAYFVLLKVDSVRRIDHVIDYFGEVSTAASSRRAQIADQSDNGEGSQAAPDPWA